MGVRIDVLLLDCLGEVAVSMGGPRAQMVWEGVLRDIAAEKLKEAGVSDKPMTAVDAARHLGFLGPDPNIIEAEIVNSPKKKRRAR